MGCTGQPVRRYRARASVSRLIASASATLRLSAQMMLGVSAAPPGPWRTSECRMALTPTATTRWPSARARPAASRRAAIAAS